MHIGTIPLHTLDLHIGVFNKDNWPGPRKMRTNLAMSQVRESLADSSFRSELNVALEESGGESAAILGELLAGKTLFYRELVIGPVQLTLVAARAEDLQFRIMRPGEHNDQPAALEPHVLAPKRAKSEKVDRVVDVGDTSHGPSVEAMTMADCLRLSTRVSRRIEQLLQEQS